MAPFKFGKKNAKEKIMASQVSNQKMVSTNVGKDSGERQKIATNLSNKFNGGKNGTVVGNGNGVGIVRNGQAAVGGRYVIPNAQEGPTQEYQGSNVHYKETQRQPQQQLPQQQQQQQPAVGVISSAVNNANYQPVQQGQMQKQPFVAIAGNEEKDETPWNRVKLLQSPFPRYRHVASSYASDSNEVFVIGGLHDQSVYGDTWIIKSHENGNKFTSKTVEITETTPPPRVGHASTLCGNAFVIFGGDTHKTNAEGLMDDDVYLLNINSHKWTIPRPVGPRPLGRYGHKISIIATSQMKTKLYVFGGQFDDTYFNDLAVYDLSSFRRPDSHWQFLKPVSFVPPPLTNHTMVSYDYKLWVFGGDTPQGLINELFMYDPTTNDWSVVDTTGVKPPPLQEHAALLYKDLMCIVGGKDDQDNYSQEVYFLNLKSFRWFKLPHFRSLVPSPRSGHSVTLLSNKKLLIMGGDKFDYAGPGEGEFSTADQDLGEGTILYTLDLTNLEDYCPNVFDTLVSSPPQRTSSQSTSVSTRTTNNSVTTPMLPSSAFTPSTSPSQSRQNPHMNILSPGRDDPQTAKGIDGQTQFYDQQQAASAKTPQQKQQQKINQYSQVDQQGKQGVQINKHNKIQNSKQSQPVQEQRTQQSKYDRTNNHSISSSGGTQQNPRSPLTAVSENSDDEVNFSSITYSQGHEKTNKRLSFFGEEYDDGELGIGIVGNSPARDDVRKQSVSTNNMSGRNNGTPRKDSNNFTLELPGSFTPSSKDNATRSPKDVRHLYDDGMPGPFTPESPRGQLTGALEEELDFSDGTPIVQPSHNVETSRNVKGALNGNIRSPSQSVERNSDRPDVSRESAKSVSNGKVKEKIGELTGVEKSNMTPKSTTKDSPNSREMQRIVSPKSAQKQAPRTFASPSLSHHQPSGGGPLNFPSRVASSVGAPKLSQKDSSTPHGSQPSQKEQPEVATTPKLAIRRDVSQGSNKASVKDGENHEQNGTAEYASAYVPSKNEEVRRTASASNEFVMQLLEELQELKAQTEKSASEASDRIRTLEIENSKLKASQNSSGSRSISGATADAGTTASRFQTNLELLKADKSVYAERVDELEHILESNILDAERLNKIIESQSQMIDNFGDEERSRLGKYDELEKQFESLKVEHEKLKAQDRQSLNEVHVDIKSHTQRMNEVLSHLKSQQGDDKSMDHGFDGVRGLEKHQLIIDKLSKQVEDVQKENMEITTLHEELLHNYESLQKDYDSISAELLTKQNEINYLEKNYKSSLSSVTNSSKALQLSQHELEKLKQENVKLREQIEDFTLSPSTERGNYNHSKSDDPPMSSFNNAHYDLRIKDLKAELYITSQERDSLKDELLQLKKRLITMED
ncbi:uncharacterized protein Ecym_2061 [Eremothecium cymbalariae DBVPG|uniref:Uncharacterized protein n=1 Tax=Eremothecium cymbalariae (strain CBS 270.75 / DBVPG 7215 / KCTC 17166 / NRRL Y-17582) TaxID=931890 RepID=G8JP18_ERECY|nr:Hypothetical protein Ecym_2061 [Eremothecium cymbalariae DBVPG\